MLEVFLFGFHLLDFAANPGDLLFNFEDVADLAGALGENGLEPLFGFAGVFEALDQVGVLLSDFFAALVFEFDAAEGLEFGERRGELRRGHTERRLEKTSSILRSIDTEICSISAVA